MQPYSECPQVLRDFLSYHESIKGQSRRTVSEYHLDLRMFLRFLTLMRKELPYQTPLDEIDIKWIDAPVLDTVSSSEVFDFLSYLTNDRQNREGPADVGIAAAARARKLSAIKAFYKYLTISTKQIQNNPVKDIEFPKIRRSLPKYLTLEESTALLKSVDGPNKNRDFAILMLFLNCGIRRSELVGLNLTDVCRQGQQGKNCLHGFFLPESHRPVSG
jgi:site-specific recombinase XerD